METSDARKRREEREREAAARCAHENTWFDRCICPPPCEMMHYYCSDCGALVGYCALRSGLEAQPPAWWEMPGAAEGIARAKREAKDEVLTALESYVRNLTRQFQEWRQYDKADVSFLVSDFIGELRWRNR